MRDETDDRKIVFFSSHGMGPHSCLHSPHPRTDYTTARTRKGRRALCACVGDDEVWVVSRWSARFSTKVITEDMAREVG